MIKHLSTIFAICCLLISSNNASAGVRSIVSDRSNSDVASYGDGSSGGSYSYDEPTFEINADKLCPSAGFTKHGCPSGYRPIGECPYDSGYYAGCCLASYKYRAEDCIAANMKPSSDNCMDYYACEAANN